MTDFQFDTLMAHLPAAIGPAVGAAVRGVFSGKRITAGLMFVTGSVVLIDKLATVVSRWFG